MDGVWICSPTRGPWPDPRHHRPRRARRPAREGNIGVYIGFDPTADSLHVGHLVGQLFLRRFQLAGHRPFPLAGGATGMVGDPGGRSEERNLLDPDTLRHNVECIKRPAVASCSTSSRARSRRRWSTTPTGPQPITMLEFLRDVGKYVTVNQMMAKDSVRIRLESEHGISFTEFSYMLLQANDFRHLYEHHGVELQAGASDQWGNIVAGVDLIRRRLGAQAFADHASADDQQRRREVRQVGRRRGVARPGDAPRRTSSASSGCRSTTTWSARYLKMLSLRPLDEIEALLAEHAAAPERRVAQRALADEMTTLVHGAARGASRRGGRRRAVRRRSRPARRRRRSASVAAEVPIGRRCPASSTACGCTSCSCGAGLAKSNSEVAPPARPGCGPCRQPGARRRRACCSAVRPAQRAVRAAAQGQARLSSSENFLTRG